MRKFFSQRKKKTILTALALGLCLLTPWHRAEAVTSYTTPNGLFRLDYYGPGESFTGKWYEDNMIEGSLERDIAYMTSQGELPGWQKERLNFAADYWDAVLKHTKKAKQPVTLAVMRNNDLDNAVAEGSDSDMEINGQTVTISTPNAVLNHGKVLRLEDGPAGFAVIGMLVFPPDGEQTRYDTPLPHCSQIALPLTMIHEIGHALGFWASDAPMTRFSEKANLYESHLYDWRGVQAQPGMEIQTANHEAATEPYFDLPGFDNDRPDCRLWADKFFR